MNGGRKMGCRRGKNNASYGLWSVSRNTLRERKLLEACEMGFLYSFLNCLIIFKVEGSNLQLKFADGTISKDVMFLGAVCR